MRFKPPKFGLLRLCAPALLVCATVVLADELPKEMLLQCEGKSKLVLMGDRKPEFHEDSFKMLLRLRDRTAVSPEAPNIVLGTGCNLEDGVIRCELQENLYNPEFNSTEKRRLSVSIVRETGELRQLIETWTFKGKGTAGKPYINSRVQKTGVCRAVGRPIF